MRAVVHDRHLQFATSLIPHGDCAGHGEVVARDRVFVSLEGIPVSAIDLARHHPEAARVGEELTKRIEVVVQLPVDGDVLADSVLNLNWTHFYLKLDEFTPELGCKPHFDDCSLVRLTGGDGELLHECATLVHNRLPIFRLVRVRDRKPIGEFRLEGQNAVRV